MWGRSTNRPPPPPVPSAVMPQSHHPCALLILISPFQSHVDWKVCASVHDPVGGPGGGEEKYTPLKTKVWNPVYLLTTILLTNAGVLVASVVSHVGPQLRQQHAVKSSIPVNCHGGHTPILWLPAKATQCWRFSPCTCSPSPISGRPSAEGPACSVRKLSPRWLAVYTSMLLSHSLRSLLTSYYDPTSSVLPHAHAGPRLCLQGMKRLAIPVN